MSEIHLVNTEAWRPDQNHKKHDVKQAENCPMSADTVKKNDEKYLKIISGSSSIKIQHLLLVSNRTPSIIIRLAGNSEAVSADVSCFSGQCLFGGHHILFLIKPLSSSH